MSEKENIELNEQQKRFCEEYVLDWNASRAYKVAYPKEKADETVNSAASRLLTNVKVQAVIKALQKDIEKVAGISRLMVANEYKKIAFSNISSLHNTWIERKEFESLTEEQKSCIQEIETKILKKNIGTAKEPEIVDVEHIKVKLYDKKAALDSLSKMLGYNEPEKHNVDVTGSLFLNTLKRISQRKEQQNGTDKG